ncbi:tetratricopeptide repeat protein [Demequina sp. NBRC 110053]|uniref:tetratricopeptide repeat protein n=1 Tax=Demequina sp. NBRC 110053 TaxID=1570342 RepID=UPI000A05A4F1|nr:tetratricopeptide repeat protein [Demequina sp. NBRC 110053]
MTSENSEAPLRGSVDLSQLLGGQTQASEGEAPATASALPAPVQVTEQSLQELAQQSTQVPILIVFLSSASPASKELVDRMRAVVARYPGQFVLGTCDIDVQGGLAQAFQVSAVPTVMALIAARPAPLFQGTADDEQIAGVLDQVLEVARQNGVTGRVDAAPQEPAGEPEPEPLPPLHQEAYDAIEREDYAAAIDAYDRALRENPKDAEARAGRAQVSLMERSRLADLDAVRRAAADHPDDVDAQLAVADLDVMGGQVEDAFGRLIDLVRRTFGDDRERIRTRLVELFEVVGPTDPRVAQARQSLASALF